MVRRALIAGWVSASPGARLAMGAVVIGLGLFFVLAVVMAFATVGNRSAPMRPEVRERLLALEFRGVVIANDRMAHAFDAGYSCRVKIKCDDGADVVLTTSVFNEDKFPVGARVVKRAGQDTPERE